MFRRRRQIGDGMKADSIDHGSSYNFLQFFNVLQPRIPQQQYIYVCSGRRQIGDGMKADSIDHGSSYNFPVL